MTRKLTNSSIELKNPLKKRQRTPFPIVSLLPLQDFDDDPAKCLDDQRGRMIVV